MSKDIIIQEGGYSKSFSGVRILRTAQAGGGNIYWVPQDEAARAGVTGTKNGKTYTVTTNQSGALVETLAPVSIAVTTPPIKTSYIDGETVDYTGMVVKAYDSDGNLWTAGGLMDGVIPFEQLLLPDTKANINLDFSGRKIDDPVLNAGVPFMGYVGGLFLEPGVKYYSPVDPSYYIESTVPACITMWPNVYIFGSTEPGKVKFTCPRVVYTIDINQYEYTYKEHHVWFMITGGGLEDDFPFDLFENVIPNSRCYNPRSYSSRGAEARIIWMIIYGDDTGDVGIYEGQELRVQWIRPGDLAMLETGFRIAVTSAET